MIQHSCSQSFVGLIPAPDLFDMVDKKGTVSTSCPATPLSNPFDSEFFPKDETCEAYKYSPFPTVVPRELKDMMQNPGKYGYSNIIILDARFDYEFRGGNIIGARNVRSKSQMVGIYNRYKNQNVCIIIHCEFSKNRGPTLIRIFREYDRSVNKYPELAFPNLFLLEGGYQRFYSECPEMCTGGYTTMRDDKYVQNGDLKRSNSFFIREMLQQKRNIKPRALKRCLSQGISNWSSFTKTSSFPAVPIL